MFCHAAAVRRLRHTCYAPARRSYAAMMPLRFVVRLMRRVTKTEYACACSDDALTLRHAAQVSLRRYIFFAYACRASAAAELCCFDILRHCRHCMAYLHF